MFIVVAIVIFGIFVGLSYTVFGSTLQPAIVSIFENSFDNTNKDINNQKYYGEKDVIISEETDFVFNAETGTITDYIGSETDIVIPYKINNKTVTTIGNMAFNKKGLNSVKIPSSITTIEDGKHWSHSDNSGAFKGNNLTSIILPNSITHIGIGAFADNQLVSVTLPNNIKRLETDVFRNNKIISIELPVSLEYIGSDAFEKNALTSIIIPKNVTYIDFCAFNLNKLTSVTLNDGLETIGSSSFASNVNLKTIKIPTTVKFIAKYSFHATTIKEVIVPINSTVDPLAFPTGVTMIRK